MFKITQNKGFQITFKKKNGWTVSVQFGAGNYCQNRSLDNFSDWLVPNTDLYKALPSKDAEIAAWDANGKWYRFKHDTVKGYCSPAEVLQFMNKIAKKRKR